MTSYTRIIDKREAVKKAEEQGMIADSDAIRQELIEKCERGEITPDQMQAELKRIKRDGKKKGLLTKNQFYNRA